jgi:two-component system response regulator MprA
MSGLHILVVDDNRDFADGLAELLAGEGHRAEVAYSGEEALEKWRHGPYDFVCMDLVLPGIDGGQTLSRMGPGVRSIAMTAFSFRQIRETALRSGAMKVLEKPIDPGELLAIVDLIAPRE